MKNKRTTKIIAGALAIASTIAMNPVGANAAWKQNSTGWWYTEGNSYATGWRTIGGQKYYFYSNGYMATKWVNLDGKWYYFYADGSMAKNAWVDGYYVGEDGAMVQYVGFDKIKLSEDSVNNSRYSAGYYNAKYWSNNKIYTLSINGHNYLDELEGSHIINSIYIDKYSDYAFDLNGKYKAFSALIGIDDFQKVGDFISGAKVRFTFIGDGKVLEQRLMSYGEDAEKIEVDLRGVNKFIVRVTGVDSYCYRSYDILDGKFYFK